MKASRSLRSPAARALRAVWAAALVLGLASAAQADVELPAVFGNGMVLQRDRPVPVWGWAEPGEEVRVEYAGQAQVTRADAEGRWRVTLDPMEARLKGTSLVVRGKNRLRLRDVVVGEVWVASGQSNMEWPLSHADDAPRGTRFPPPDRVRFFRVPHAARALPQADVAGTWASGADESARKAFSAVAWFFACDVAEATHVPVGILDATWGGTAILPWTPAAESPAPSRGAGAAAGPQQAAALWNGMVCPLVPYALRGVIWYQGESDAARAAEYRTWFPDMIGAWRSAWGQGDVPFLFVQLANFMARADEPSESAWAELRDAQLRTLRNVSATGMAVAIDVGEAGDIHPRNKHAVGARLARWARVLAYGEALVPSGPLYVSHDVADGAIRVRFEHAEGLAPARGRRLEGFAVAGEDRRFVWAEARIEGDTVVVSSPQVPAPVAVRYSWADNPAGNLVNGERLPASPFRTDDAPTR